MSAPLRVRTLKTTLRQDDLPSIVNAQFNEIREAICFELEGHSTVESATATAMATTSSTTKFSAYQQQQQQLKDVLIRIDISLNDELLNAAKDIYQASIMNVTNKSILLADNNSNGGSSRSKSAMLEEDLLRLTEASTSRTFYISLNKLKYGQNCISYSQLVDLDSLARNMTGGTASLRQQQQQQQHLLSMQKLTTSQKPEKRVFTLLPLSQLASLAAASPASLPSQSKALPNNANLLSSSFDTLTRSFYDFKRLNKVNITLCFVNDSNICANETIVSGKITKL
jgi:hypothetical protein